jgi:hypothetical protein
MRNSANPEPVVIDGSTAYVLPDPAGLGPTVERALAAGDSNVRHVAVCGDRPGAGRSGAAAWASERGRWFLTSEPHITRSAMRVQLAADGRRVQVTRVEPWFGVGVDPESAAGGMRVLRNATMKLGVRPVATPGRTGRMMLAACGLEEWAPVPAPVADILRSTTGQGRFELFEAARTGGPAIVSVDARFQYGALAQLELPTRSPVIIDGEPADEYAPSWCEVEFSPNGGRVGLLGVNGLGGWSWPTDGGPHRTWCAGAEVHLARRAGYRVTVRRAIVWPVKARPLAPWARLIVNQRDRIDALPLPEGVRDAARAGLRAILVQTIGALHGSAGASPSVFASAEREGGASVVHPEWSTAIWAAARTRLARVLLEQTAAPVACALDGFYVAGEPVIAVDDGKAGRWREVWRGGAFEPMRSMSDLYALKAGDQ